MIHANRNSACPVEAQVPIEAAGIIPVSQNDVAGIPNIALYIPDFEGQAILRIFSNSTQAEIGCFVAQITNGNSFRQKPEVGLVLGAFTMIAILSSFATAVYGDKIVDTRKHYAHSLSVMVVFAVWHYIYFGGALSMNWPNVLVSFWSNYAWTGGMVYSEHMQNIINDLIDSNKGNTSHVGAAGTGVNNPGLGGGYDIHAIYKREMKARINGFSYSGHPVKPGLPLPGNFSGFAGTLAQDQIPASNAFITCLLWSLTLIACLIILIMSFKLLLEWLSKTRIIKADRLAFFRAHYVGFTALAILRAAFIGFFMTVFISMFQFSYLRSAGPVAVACVVFLIVVFGVGTAAGLACYCRVSGGKYVCQRDVLLVERTRMWRIIPWYHFSQQSESPRSEDKVYVGSIPWWAIRASSGEKSVHEDDKFIKSYGWLASRYRRTRWWFFAAWLIYEFIRACFLAGASSRPLVQVFGLVGVEFVALVGIIYLQPFEGQRLNVLLVYLLGFSKLATTVLSVTFDTHLNLPRIVATVIGIIIIIIQSLLTLVVLSMIVIGAITSYFSIVRNQAEMRPKRWIPTRDRYFERITVQAQDIPRSHSVSVEPVQDAYKGPCFSVNQVKRVPKIEDEDDEFLHEIYNDAHSSRNLVSSKNQPRANERPLLRNPAASNLSQVSCSTLPRAVRIHRPSWISQEFAKSRDVARVRASSDIRASTSEKSSRATSRALPRLNTQGSSCENVEEHTSPLSLNEIQHSSSASSPIPYSYDDADGTCLLQPPESRPIVSTGSSSRPPLETIMIEEDIPPIL
jgi:hypothetical protein